MAVDRAWLEAAALFYLERYQASAENLRRVLLRKIWRRARLGGDPADLEAEASEEARRSVDALIARFVASGILDDRAFARAKVETLHRRGYSRRAISMRLQAKGVERDLIQQELTEDDGALRPGGDLAAAAALARRRRLGPYRPGDRAAMVSRDLAVLCRAGFGLSLARQVIECPDVSTLAELATDSFR